MISTTCPGCGKGLKAPDALAGRTGACPGCGATVSFPAPAAAPSPTAPVESPQPAAHALRPDADPSELFADTAPTTPAADPPAVAKPTAPPVRAAAPAQPRPPATPGTASFGRKLDKRLLWIIGGVGAGIMLLLVVIIVLLVTGKEPAPAATAAAPTAPAGGTEAAAGAAVRPATPPVQAPSPAAPTAPTPVAAVPAQPAPTTPAAAPPTTPDPVPATPKVELAAANRVLVSRMLQARQGQSVRPTMCPPGRIWVVLQLAAASTPPHAAVRALRLRLDDGSELAPVYLGSINQAIPAPPPHFPPEAGLRRVFFLPLAEADAAAADTVAFDAPAQATGGKLSDGQALTWMAGGMGMGGMPISPGGMPGRTQPSETVPTVAPMVVERIAIPGTLERPLPVLGDGRLPLLLSAPTRSLVLFDPGKKAFGTPFPLPSAGTMVAVGGDRLVCHVPELGKFQVFDLATGKETAAFPSPEQNQVLAIGMARGVGDRLWAELRRPNERLAAAILSTTDGRILERTEPVSDGPSPPADGLRLDDQLNTVVLSSANTMPQAASRGSGGWQRIRNMAGNMSAVVPLNDGSLVAACGMIRPRNPETPLIILNRLWLAPIHGLDAMLAIDPRNGGLAVHQFGKTAPLLSLGGIPGWTARRAGERPLAFLPERFWLDLERKRLLLVPPDESAILLASCDLAERLRAEKVPHFLVRSPPAPPAVQGEAWSMQLQAMTDQGKAAFRLARGPDGMAVDANGRLTWQVPPRASAPEQVCVELQASGAARLHELTLLPVRRSNGGIETIPRLPGMSPNCDYLDLGGPVVEVCEAQGGRYAVLSVGERRALVILDVAAGREIAAIPWPGEKPAVYAAGGKLVVVAASDGSSLAVHDLGSGKSLRRLEAPMPAPIVGLAMGTDRDDVVACSARSDRSGAIDLVATADGRRRGITFSRAGKPVPAHEFTYPFSLRANADLTMLCAWRQQTSPSGRFLLTGQEAEWTFAYEHEDGGNAWPTTPGEGVVCANAILDPALHPVATIGTESYRFALRPVNGSPLLLGISEERVDLYRRGTSEPLCNIATLPPPKSDARTRDLALSCRASYSQALGKGYLVPAGYPGILLLNGLQPSGAAPVLATPSPLTYIPGKPLSIRLEPLVADAKLRFALVEGPEGLRLEPDGSLRWSPATGQRGAFDLRIKLSGQAGEGVAKLALIPRALDLADQGSWEGGAGDRLLLGAGRHRIAVDAGAKHALLVEGNVLWSLEAGSLRPLQRLALDSEVQRTAVRGDEALVVQGGELRLLSLPSLKQVRSFPLPSREVYDLVALPGKRLSFIACRDPAVADRVLCRRVVQVNETTGKVLWLDKVFGQMLAVTPDGRTLFTALQEFVSDTSTLVDQWGQRFLVTRTGNISLLVRYSLNGASGTAEQMHEDPGQDLLGLRVSGDGKYLTPLSRGGYRLAGGNGHPIALLGSGDLGRCEVLLECSDPPGHLAYHPLLPLVLGGNANRGEGASAWLTDYASSKRRIGNLAAANGIELVEQLTFSPDGLAAWVIGESKGKRHLVAIPLGLKDEEARQVAAWKRSRVADGTSADDRGGSGGAPGKGQAAAAAPGEPALRITRGQLRSLTEPGNQGKMDTRELARRYQDAVVLILQDQGSGSGFLVSNDGLVATCAHVLPAPGQPVQVQLRDPGKNQPVTLEAKVVARDDRQDLALLKVECRFATPYVRCDAQNPQMGEEVSVIGNPGMGAQVLTKTMTTGIISNPARSLEGQVFLQTSAAVNPGCSGGPLFNSQGNVIGMVTLKARIEATAFAIPLRTVAAFLESCCAAPGKGR